VPIDAATAEFGEQSARHYGDVAADVHVCVAR